MITEDYRLICDKCGEEVDLLLRCTSESEHGWCEKCCFRVYLYFGTKKVGRYTLYPDGTAQVFLFDQCPYWAAGVWEAQAKMAEHPLNVMFQLGRGLERKARQFLAKVNSG